MTVLEYDLVIVIPCYNEEKRLPLQQVLEWADRRRDWLWLLVDDGSRDATQRILSDLDSQRANITALILPQNVGKAEAIRHALAWAEERSSAPWLSYLDADFATPPAELERMHQIHAKSHNRMVMGCRLQRLGAQIERTATRHYLGRVAATIISLILKMPTYDTQCGAKLIHRSLVPLILREPFLSRWLFDMELLARARNYFGLKAWMQQVVEEPLNEWQEMSGTKLRPRDLLRMPYEFWRLHRHYNRPG